MTNPDNIVRVRARNGGRASVYEANGWAQAYSDGLLEGNGVVQNTSADMSVLVGGSATKPDVVLAKNPAGYKIALDLVGQQAVTLTAPASNSRISAVVAYTDDLSLSTDETTTTGSPASCGLIVVNGTAAATPSAPTDAQIRSAITSDGATGSQASYAIIATIEVASSTTVITNSLIKNNEAKINTEKIDFATLGGCNRYAESQSITASTETVVLFPNSIITDSNIIEYNNNGTFTVKKSGWYIVCAEVGGSSDCQHTTEIVINNVEHKSSRSHITGVNYVEASCCVKLNKGSTIQIKVVAGKNFTIDSRAKGNVDICLVYPMD